MEESDDSECSSTYSDAEDLSGPGALLGSSLNGDALARSLVEASTANELGLLRTELGRLRCKIKALERERDDMVDNFQTTTKILLERIKGLEQELSETRSRPQTAAVIERIEKPLRASDHAPEVMRIEEDEEVTICLCGNCGKEIPAGNLISHNLYCYSNNWRCAVCDEVLHVREKEAHFAFWTSHSRLLSATAARDKLTVQRIAEHGLDLNQAQDPNGDGVMHIAARLGDVDLIGFFVAFGVDVDVANNDDETPLHLAAATSDAATKLLAELGARLNVVTKKGETPLTLVCRRGSAASAKLLVEMRADAEASTRLGDTPLQIAQRAGFHETVFELCKAGAPLRPGTPGRERSPLPRPVLRDERLAALPLAAGAQAGYPPLPPKMPGRQRA